MLDCFKPRWYQEDAVTSVFNYYIKGNTGHPIIVCPTGAGKAHILGMICARVMESWPGQNILVLSHSSTIVEQDYTAICSHVYAANVGMFCSKLKRKERKAVTVGCIGSVANNRHFFKGVDVIIVDECHRIPHGSEGQYRQLFDKLRRPVIGLTATAFRRGSGYLHKGDGALFTDIIYEVDFLELLDAGYLSNLVTKRTDLEMDVRGIRKQGGDFAKKELDNRFNRDEITADICDDLVTYKNTCKKWLVFAINIDHAESIARMLSERGIKAVTLHSKQNDACNKASRGAFEDGDAQALVSVESITTGYDYPAVDLLAILRPTSSPVLHIQILGRGTRVIYAEGYDLLTVAGRLAAIAAGPKPFCLVRDYAGNVRRLGPINAVAVPDGRKKKRSGGAITKTCPKCNSIEAGAAKFCSVCGHEFVFREKITKVAATVDVIQRKATNAAKPVQKWFPVNSVRYGIHKGKTGKTTLQVLHACGTREFNNFLYFEPGARAHYFAAAWWRRRSVDKRRPAPLSVKEAYDRAMAGELRPPAQIMVEEKPESFPEIKQVKMQ